MFFINVPNPNGRYSLRVGEDKQYMDNVEICRETNKGTLFEGYPVQRHIFLHHTKNLLIKSLCSPHESNLHHNNTFTNNNNL